MITKKELGFDQDKIYRYTDVSGLTFHPKNREIDQRNVKQFKQMMLNGEYDTEKSVITVDYATKQIYDGQHRVEAYKQAKKEGYNQDIRVMYIEAPETLEAQRKLINDLNNGKHWNINDRIHSFIDDDNDLRKLEKFCLSHPRLYKEKKNGKNKGERTAFMRRGAAVITGDPTYYKRTLYDGTFRPSKEDWADAENIYNEVMGILKATRLDNQSDIPALEGIINGWYSIHNDTKLSKKINALPKKVKTLYEFMDPDTMDVRHTTSKEQWRDRFKAAVENAYKVYA